MKDDSMRKVKAAKAQARRTIMRNKDPDLQPLFSIEPLDIEKVSHDHFFKGKVTSTMRGINVTMKNQTRSQRLPFEIRRLKYASLVEQKVYDLYLFMRREFWRIQ